MQKYENMTCAVCGKENPAKHQDFCADLGCSGRMVIDGKERAESLRLAKMVADMPPLPNDKKSIEEWAKRLADDISKGRD